LTADFSPVLVGLGVGIALAGAPGPVQAILLSEALRGGVSRGLLALAGSAGTFAVLLVATALGLSIATPDPAVLRILKLAGGAFLIWLAVDGFRSASADVSGATSATELNPTARGSMAIVLNVGTWLFIAAVASPLIATAAQRGGLSDALLVALAMLVGAASGDFAFVLLAGAGLRRMPPEVTRNIRRGLAVVLATLGVVLIAGAVL
jgi:threonine/homoserine/homoserine lactone efflux protein